VTGLRPQRYLGTVQCLVEASTRHQGRDRLGKVSRREQTARVAVGQGGAGDAGRERGMGRIAGEPADESRRRTGEDETGNSYNLAFPEHRQRQPCAPTELIGTNRSARRL
jgi:hypothetical protein